MRLQRLTGLEREKIKKEYDETMAFIKDCNDILSSETRRFDIVKKELIEVKTEFGDVRKTEIQYLTEEMNMLDLIEKEDVVITISHNGYVKRTPVSEFRQQKRGGRGAKGSATREEDFIEHVLVASTHSTLLLFTQTGKCFWLKVYELTEGEINTKGRPIQNLLAIASGDKIKAVIDIADINNEEYMNTHFVLLCTKKGIIKKTSLEEFSRPRTSGINAITIEEGDMLFRSKINKW